MNEIMTTETTDLDLSLAREFEYRKKKIELIQQGREAYDNIEAAINNESSVEALRAAALTFAKGGIDQAIENVDNAIAAFASVRKYKSALDAMKFLLLLLIVSNIATGSIVWLILR